MTDKFFEHLKNVVFRLPTIIGIAIAMFLMEAVNYIIAFVSIIIN